MLMPFIGEHPKEHFLVDVLGAKRIHEDRGASLVRVDQRAALIDLLEQFGGQHAAIDKIDPKITVVQLPFQQLEVARIGYRSRITLRLEKLLEQLKLPLGWESSIIHYRDLGVLTAAANPLVNCDQR